MTVAVNAAPRSTRPHLNSSSLKDFHVARDLCP